MSARIAKLRDEIQSLLDDPINPADVDVAELTDLFDSVNRLRAALEPPPRILWDLLYSSQLHAATEIARDMGVFDAFGATVGTELTLDQIDAKTKGDKILLLRILRLLCVQNIFDTTPQGYKSTPFAAFLAETPNNYAPIALSHFHGHMKAYAELPEFIRQGGFINPMDAWKGPWQKSHLTDKHYFDWLVDHPDRLHKFSTTMKMNRTGGTEPWYDLFPVQEKLKAQSDKEVIFVDIGGGYGHDTMNFRNRFPPEQLKGRMVLQDLPGVVNGIGPEQLPQGLEALGHDMFKEQPLKGAKAYYLRMVIHDWPDPPALEILASVRKAMSPGSILLLNENVMPETGFPKGVARVDMTMMLCFASWERTERQWKELLDKAGFDIVNKWTFKTNAGARLFEAVPRQESLS